MWKKLFLAGLIWMACFGAATQALALDEQAAYKQAQALLDRWTGDPAVLDQAESILKEILAVNQGSAPALTGLGRLAYKRGYIRGDQYQPQALQEAKDYINRAVKADPKFFDAYFYGAYAWLFSSDLEKAREMADKCSDLAPDSARAKLLQAEIAYWAKNYDSGQRLAREALSQTSDKNIQSDVYTLLIKVYEATGHDDLAESSHLKKIELSPDSPWAAINYANFLIRRKKDYDKAIEYAEKALAIMEFGVGRRVLARAYYEKGMDLLQIKGRALEAEACFNTTLEKYPNYARAYHGLGLAQLALSLNGNDAARLDLAEKDLLLAIRSDPDFEEARQDLARVEEVRRQAAGQNYPEGGEKVIVAALMSLAEAQKAYIAEHGEYAPHPELLSDLGQADRAITLAISPDVPYGGYYFKGLKKQAQGFVDLKTGFVFVAEPAAGSTGGYTYVIGPANRVFRKNLGGHPVDNAAQIDASWEAVN